MKIFEFRDRMGGHILSFDARNYEEAFQEAREFLCSPVLVAQYEEGLSDREIRKIVRCAAEEGVFCGFEGG